MLKVILTAAAVLGLAAGAASACQLNNTKTTQSPTPAVTAQAPIHTPAPVAQAATPSTQDVAQATIAKPTTETKTN